jgi:hypothetical protein
MFHVEQSIDFCVSDRAFHGVEAPGMQVILMRPVFPANDQALFTYLTPSLGPIWLKCDTSSFAGVAVILSLWIVPRGTIDRGESLFHGWWAAEEVEHGLQVKKTRALGVSRGTIRKVGEILSSNSVPRETSCNSRWILILSARSGE